MIESQKKVFNQILDKCNELFTEIGDESFLLPSSKERLEAMHENKWILPLRESEYAYSMDVYLTELAHEKKIEVIALESIAIQQEWAKEIYNEAINPYLSTSTFNYYQGISEKIKRYNKFFSEQSIEFRMGNRENGKKVQILGYYLKNLCSKSNIVSDEIYKTMQHLPYALMEGIDIWQNGDLEAMSLIKQSSSSAVIKFNDIRNRNWTNGKDSKYPNLIEKIEVATSPICIAVGLMHCLPNDENGLPVIFEDAGFKVEPYNPNE
jgi:hypothetical protein